MKQKIAIGLLGILLLLVGCSSSRNAKKSYKDTSKQSANNFYNAGMLRCSVNNPTFDDVCDYAVYYENKVMKIIVENSAVHNSISYRIFYFAAGRFRTQNKKELVRTQKLASNHYQIRVGKEYYLMPQRALTYQPMDENITTNRQKKSAKPVLEEKPIEVIAAVVPKVEKPIVVAKSETKPVVKAQPVAGVGTSRKFKR